MENLFGYHNVHILKIPPYKGKEKEEEKRTYWCCSSSLQSQEDTRRYSYSHHLCMFHCLHTGMDDSHQCLTESNKNRLYSTIFNGLGDKVVVHDSTLKTFPLPDELNILVKVVLKLTDGAVFSFKASYAGTSVVVHSVNTHSIVFTRARITVINIWRKKTKKKRLSQLK